MSRGTTGSDEGRKVEVIRLSVPCGFCITGHHKNCIPELKYYSKVWLCGCDCAKEYQYSGDEVN